MLRQEREVEAATRSKDQQEQTKGKEKFKTASGARCGKKGSRKLVKRWSTQRLQGAAVKGIVRAFGL